MEGTLENYYTINPIVMSVVNNVLFLFPQCILNDALKLSKFKGYLSKEMDRDAGTSEKRITNSKFKID